MSSIENPDAVAEMIREGLSRFAATHPGLCAERAVVWFEPEHNNCALYISTDAHTPKLLPTEFDFPNFGVTDVFVRSDYLGDQKEFWREAEQLVRDTSRELPDAINPKRWAIQAGFDYYNEWEITVAKY